MSPSPASSTSDTDHEQPQGGGLIDGRRDQRRTRTGRSAASSRPGPRRSIGLIVAVALLAVAARAGAQTSDPEPTTTAPTTVAPTSTEAPTTTIPVGPDTPVVGPETPLTTAPGQTTTTLDGVPAPPTLSPDELAELRSLSSDYELATADEVDLLKRYLDAQEQASSIADEVNRLNLQLTTVQAELDAAQRKVDAADADLAVVEARLGETQQELDTERDRLRRQAVEADMGGGSVGGTATAEAVVKATSMNELRTSMVYADSVVGEQRRTIERVSELRDQVEALLDDADAKQQSASQARDEVGGRKQAVEDQRAAQELLRTKVQANADLQAKLLQEVAGKRQAYAERIMALTKVSDGISDTLASRQKGQSLPLITTGIMAPPLDTISFSSPFGPRVDPILGGAAMHNGVDLSASSGTPIKASADGVVVIASEQGGYGNCTVIDHGSGLGTLYGHQSRIDVQVGDVVKRGQVIGYVGSTGKSTGPHLHWEVRQFGQPVDPVPYLGAR